jgi:hypothetical protein
LLGLEKPGIHARHDGSASKLPAQTQERSQATGKEVSLAERPAGPIDGLPADCPISIAAGALFPSIISIDGQSFNLITLTWPSSAQGLE